MFAFRFLFAIGLVLSVADCSTCMIVQDSYRIDCHPHANASESECLARGCCWKDPLAGSDTRAPSCFYPRGFNSYRIESIQSIVDGVRYIISKPEPSFVPKDILRLAVDLTFIREDIARLRITDPLRDRFEVPYVYNESTTSHPHLNDFSVSINPEPFAITIKHKRTGETIFDSGIGPLIYADQFIQISTSLPSKNIYGLGEHRNPYNLQSSWQTLSFWNRDQPPVLNHNLYGTQPMAMYSGKNGNKYGIFLLNANAMDAVIQPAPALTFRTIGGIIDLFIYAGPSSFDVVRQHYTVVQKPHFQPYWAFGFNLCRYGYKNLNEIQDIYNKMKFLGFPYDVQWTDIDAMKNQLVFTFDDENWSGLPEFVRFLHQNNMRYTPINDPCIGMKVPPGWTYPALEEGLKNDVFIRGNNGSLLVGRVWPGDCYFPDFTSPNAVKWWGEEIRKFNDTAPFDGFWIDMNEPANFVPGSVDGCPGTELDDPWYVPKIIGNLYEKTVCPSANNVMSTQYNLHNLYALIETKVTLEAINNLTPNKRHFILSRATFAGSGHYAGHWTGDNFAQWNDLYYSVNEMFNFNLYGIPFVGADICGFFEDTTEELCTRWMQLGAFYPFMRNHNTINVVSQDPTVFSEPSRNAMLVALYWRYRLIPYYYTLMYESHTHLKPIINPLMFLYETDKVCETLDTQFLIGTAIMVAPVLTQGATSIPVYFPDISWYDLNTYERVTENGWTNLKVDLDSVPMYIRQGSIVPSHIVTRGKNALENRNSKFLLYTVLHPTQMATGNLFWDDGESMVGPTTLINFAAVDQMLSINAVRPVDYPYTDPLILDEIVILGLTSTHARKPTVNGVPKPFSIVREALLVHEVNANMNTEEPIVVKWEYYE